MSESNKAIVEPIYRATETGEVSLLDAAVTDDVIEHPLNPGQVPGRDALKQTFGGFHLIVPDLRLTVEDMIAAGDKVAVRSSMRGTPASEYLGVPANGRPLSFTAIDIWRITNGRAAEVWHVEDFARVLIDWGVLPLPPREEIPAANSVAAPATSGPAPAEDARAVVRRWYQALHRGELAAVAGLLDPGYLGHDPIGPGLTITPDPAGTRHDVTVLREAFPDLDITLADLFTEDGKVVARVLVRGTHLGPLPGIPPTGKRMAVMGNQIWRIVGGRIAEHWGRFEELDLYQQIGLLPVPAAPRPDA
jgi:predicted ester cyclase